MGCCCSGENYDELEGKSSGKTRSLEKLDDNPIFHHSIYLTLERLESGDIEILPYKKKKIPAKVVSVYDGDTCTIIYPYGKEFLKTKIRVSGVDTPELSVRGETRGSELGELEEKAALHVKNVVQNLIEGKIIDVKMNKFDKYGGRVNGNIFLPEDCGYETLTEFLVVKKYAREYSGQKKENWTKEELEYILEN